MPVATAFSRLLRLDAVNVAVPRSARTWPCQSWGVSGTAASSASAILTLLGYQQDRPRIARFGRGGRRGDDLDDGADIGESGFPRQFIEMKLDRRCSILVHFDVKPRSLGSDPTGKGDARSRADVDRSSTETERGRNGAPSTSSLSVSSARSPSVDT